MRGASYIAIVAFAGLSLTAGVAHAQFNPTSETRSVTLNASATYDSMTGEMTAVDNDPSPQTNSSTGPWTLTQSGGLAPVAEPTQNNIATNGASQTSEVASSGFDDTATVSFGASDGATGDINADSYYTATFSVPAPTPFQLTAQYNVGDGGEGPPGTLSGYVTLSQSGTGNLFSLGVMNQGGGGDFGIDYAGGPTTFYTTLEPGNTYTLTAEAYLDRPLDITTLASGTGTVSFTASVPEPASLGILTMIGLTTLARRR